MCDKVQGSLLEDEVDEGAFMCGKIAGRVVDTCDGGCFLIFGLDQRSCFPGGWVLYELVGRKPTYYIHVYNQKIKLNMTLQQDLNRLYPIPIMLTHRSLAVNRLLLCKDERSLILLHIIKQQHSLFFLCLLVPWDIARLVC